MLTEFEKEAGARGCTLIYLDTFTFQAPGFYEKLGYSVALVTRGFAEDIQKFTLHKSLPHPPRTSRETSVIG